MKANHRQVVYEALPGTVAQIVDKTGVCRATVFRWLNELRADKLIRIGRWRRTAGLAKPYYVVGAGDDAKRPARRTDAEYARRYYVNTRRNDDMELRAIRKAARLNAKAMAKTPQSWLSALGAI